MTTSEPEKLLPLRERGKEARRARILAAASLLIRESGATDFSMQDLAKKAAVSLATTYNLIGVKAAVLYALLDQSLDVLGARQAGLEKIDSAPRRVEAHCQLAVRHFGSDAEYHRPLMRYLLGVYKPERRPLFMNRALEYWRLAFCPPGTIAEAKYLELADAMHIAFTGALDIWVHHEASSEELEQRALGIVRLLMRAGQADPP